jgi:hypothetical protein
VSPKGGGNDMFSLERDVVGATIDTLSYWTEFNLWRNFHDQEGCQVLGSERMQPLT